jgi:hypothetical protein
MPLTARSREIYECISDISKTLKDMETMGTGFGVMIYNYGNSNGSTKAQHLWERWIRVNCLLLKWIGELHSLETNPFDTRDVFKTTFETAKYQLRDSFHVCRTYELLLDESISICTGTSILCFSEFHRPSDVSHDEREHRPYQEIKQIWEQLRKNLEFMNDQIRRIRPVLGSGMQQPSAELQKLLTKLRVL